MSNKPVVYLLVSLEEDLIDRIAETCEVRMIEPGSSMEEIRSRIGEAEGIVTSPRYGADEAFFAAAPKLKVLSTHSVGYDPFDISAATRNGVCVCNTPGVLTAAVANLTTALIFCLSLRLIDNERFARTGGWARRESAPPLGHDVQGKTVGIVGFGRIGQEVTRRLQALGMGTIWYDVFDTPHPDAPDSEYRPLDQLFAESDFVSLHTNLDDSSRHMIGAEELEKMKPTAFLVHTARGPLVDQRALFDALKAGKIAGAGLDVLESEPPAEEDPICTLQNVVCFPHIGTATEETRRLMRELAVDNCIAVLAGERPPASVNPEVLES